MFIKENILLAIAGLKASKMRALLTMLGIIIGISSVIAIFSIGSSITANMSSEIDKAGINNIQIHLAVKNEDGTQGRVSSKEPEDSDRISLEQIDSFRDVFKDKINNISIEEMQGEGKVKDGYLYANVTATGVNDGYKDVKNVKIINGRFINDKDIKGMKKSAVVSDKLVNNIFKGKTNPLGKEIKVYMQDTIETYVIVGVYKYEASTIMDEGDGGSMVSEKDRATSLYVPVTTVKELQKYKNYTSFNIMPNRNVDSKKFVEDIKKYIDKLYKNNKNWTLSVFNMQNEIEGFTSQLAGMSMGVSAIAAIALLVGGIGVMNIMLVSVTERTREIGTRKALGAKKSHIRMQFITESVIICSIGGIIGVILGIGMAAIACHYLKSPMLISIPTIIISFTFSMAIGVFFGYYPAKKAASLDPIEALRYE
ncbi:ABC transporter permease [Clostridium beijerinckii]|uniref:ABC transporter permease n=1 Tax=Clostridium beijerinckii TaxID=1520 RepID=UPI001570905F|nr:ABC transporter permease [Clostridium beijerinckii]NRT74796.1 putative ABC transport system permease protein [Clostridium beijerinckii]